MARAAAARAAVKLGRRAIKKMAKKPKSPEPKSNVRVVPRKVYDRSTRGRKPTKKEEAASYKRESNKARKEAEANRSKGSPKSREKKLESLRVDRTESSRKAQEYLDKTQPRRRARRSGGARRTGGSRSANPAFVDPRTTGN